MRLAATDWPAVESFSTAVAAAIALIAVLVTLWVYSRQNRLARAAAIRSLLGVVLRDSGEIYYLTFGSAIEVAESGVREFRKKLGRSADADTFRKYFFQPDNEFHWVVWSSFMEGYVTSPAYSRLSHLWDEIEKASAELRGMLKIFNHSAKLIADTSIGACYPSLSFQLAEEMQHDSELANDYQKITNLDELTLAAATKLGHMLHQDLGPGWPVRLFQLVSFVEDLYAAITEMSDRSVLKLTSDRRFDWNYFSMVPATAPSLTASAPATEGGPAGIADDADDLEKRRQRRAGERQQKGTEQIKLIEKLLADLESLLSAEDFTKLKNRIEICKKTYDPDYKVEQEMGLRDEPETRRVSTAGLSGKRQTQI